MSNTPTTTLDHDMLAVKDQTGNHYLLSLETLERSLVPAEHTAELERLMAAATEGDTGEADAQGYLGFFAGIAVAIVVRAGFDIGYAIGSELNSPVAEVPNVTFHGSRDHIY